MIFPPLGWTDDRGFQKPVRVKVSEKTFEGQSVYVGMDVHRKGF